jgi:multicomponent Na+:H+ antiporter subunit B
MSVIITKKKKSMNSVILQLASKYLKWLLILFAVLALLRGQDDPGGGFIGGLMAGLAIVYKGFAYNAFQVKEQFTGKPEGLIALGLLTILMSIIPSALNQKTLMTAMWIIIDNPLGGEFALGTPLLFDTGIFLVVTGVTLMFAFSLTQKQ